MHWQQANDSFDNLLHGKSHTMQAKAAPADSPRTQLPIILLLTTDQQFDAAMATSAAPLQLPVAAAAPDSVGAPTGEVSFNVDPSDMSVQLSAAVPQAQ